MPSSNTNQNQVTVSVQTNVIRSSVQTNVVNAKVKAQGVRGTDGENGVGVPVGGTAGQVLSKVDATDYNTQWMNQSGGGSGTVTSVNATGANGVSISGGPITTSGSLTIGLGAISPTSVASSGTVTGTNLSGTNTGDQTSVTGNAGTATTLQTARTIGTLTGDVTTAGSSFNGSANNTNATVLATVNSNVGSFTKANITVNGKGLITAASSGTADFITSITTTGTSGPATVTSGVLNVPQYSGGGGGSGDVVGPSSATDNAIARFDTTTGKLIQNSNATISDAGDLNLTGNYLVDGNEFAFVYSGDPTAGLKFNTTTVAYEFKNLGGGDLFSIGVGTGTTTSVNDIVVPDEAYGAGWDGSLEVPTKNAVYDKIQTLSGGGITRTVVVTSGNVTAGAAANTDYVYLISAAHTVTLPTAVGNTNRYTLKNNHTSPVALAFTSGQTADGGGITLAPLSSVDLISTNSNWSII